MKIVVEGTPYEYDPNRLSVNEGIEMEKVTGLAWADLQRGLGVMQPVAVKGLVWLLKRRAGESPDWSTLDFEMGAFDVEDDPAPEVAPGPKEAADAPLVSEASGISTSDCSATRSAA